MILGEPAPSGGRKGHQYGFFLQIETAVGETGPGGRFAEAARSKPATCKRVRNRSASRRRDGVHREDTPASLSRADIRRDDRRTTRLSRPPPSETPRPGEPARSGPARGRAPAFGVAVPDPHRCGPGRPLVVGALKLPVFLPGGPGRPRPRPLWPSSGRGLRHGIRGGEQFRSELQYRLALALDLGTNRTSVVACCSSSPKSSKTKEQIARRIDGLLGAHKSWTRPSGRSSRRS
jgi:hypothetical protein